MLENAGDEHAATGEVPAVGQRNLAAEVLVQAAIVGRWMRRGGGNDGRNDRDCHELNDWPSHGGIAMHWYNGDSCLTRGNDASIGGHS